MHKIIEDVIITLNLPFIIIRMSEKLELVDVKYLEANRRDNQLDISLAPPACDTPSFLAALGKCKLDSVEMPSSLVLYEWISESFV